MRLYGRLVRLYPRSFREEFGADLVLHFEDLVADRGRRAAWARTSLDLVLTVPRYRLETLMSEETSTTALHATVIGLAVAGVLSVLVGLLPGVVLLVAAVGLAVSQRSSLARSLRAPRGDARRRRFRIAAALAVVALASVISFATAIRDDDISGTSLVLHNLIGTPAMIGALAYFVAGLVAPRSGPPSWLPAGVVALAVAVAIPQVAGGELDAPWWSIMAVSGVAGIGLLVAGMLARFAAQPTPRTP